jgi:DNA-binding GntR family transcriptional regulator
LILEGDYGPNERLVEERLAGRLGVSRTPIRQALTMLEAEGLVEIAPNKGAMVCSFTFESRNGRLEKLIRRTVEVPLMFKAFYCSGPHERTISNHYHRQILDALGAGDGERAEIVMREHVYEGRDFVIKALKEDMR